MTDPFTINRVYSALSQYMRNRRDVGLINAMQSAVLDPANPFDPKTMSRPRRWFVLLSLLTVASLGFFVYFNNLL